MIKSLNDLFNNDKAIINDPLYEIHTPCQSIDYAPDEDEYYELLSNIDHDAYPNPVDRFIYHTINPLHGVLKPIIIKYK